MMIADLGFRIVPIADFGFQILDLIVRDMTITCPKCNTSLPENKTDWSTVSVLAAVLK